MRLKVLSSHANTCCQSTLFFKLLLLFPLADKLSTSKRDGSVGVFLLLRKLAFAAFFFRGNFVVFLAMAVRPRWRNVGASRGGFLKLGLCRKRGLL